MQENDCVDLVLPEHSKQSQEEEKEKEKKTKGCTDEKKNVLVRNMTQEYKHIQEEVETREKEGQDSETFIADGQIRGVFKYRNGFVLVGIFVLRSVETLHKQNQTTLFVSADPDTGAITLRQLEPDELANLRGEEALEAFRCYKDLYCYITSWNWAPFAILAFSSEPILVTKACSWDTLVKRMDVWSGILRSHLEEKESWLFQDLLPSYFVTLSMSRQFVTPSAHLTAIDCRQ